MMISASVCVATSFSISPELISRELFMQTMNDARRIIQREQMINDISNVIRGLVPQLRS